MEMLIFIFRAITKATGQEIPPKVGAKKSQFREEIVQAFRAGNAPHSATNHLRCNDATTFSLRENALILKENLVFSHSTPSLESYFSINNNELRYHEKLRDRSSY